ncbi:MAG: Panacea domain-containing protein [Pirellulales bacterium]
MFLRFEAEKTIQAIGVVLRCHALSIASKLRILKLLYIADRESLAETGRPILGSRVVAMDHGPLHSQVLDLINGEHIDEPLFSEHFEKWGHTVRLSKDPGVGQLSRYDIEKLQDVCERYSAKSDWDLTHGITHSFPEWKNNYSEGTSKIIPLEDIIDAVGRSSDKDVILQDIADEIRVDDLFGEKSR